MMITPLYRCKQIKLYTLTRLAWRNCYNFRHLFGNISSKYTLEFINQRQEDIQYAESLPDFQGRTTKAEILRIQLTQKVRLILKTYQKLKRYISHAFPKPIRKTQWDAAGLPLYRKSAQYDWQAVQQLLDTMINYIVSNYELLSSSINMPSHFPIEVLNQKDNFITAYQTYLEAHQEAILATEIKTTANNLIYTDLQDMLADAKTLELTPTQRKQFTFSSLLKFISHSNPSGIKGTITDTETDEPITFVLLDIPSENITILSSQKGTYEISPLSEGKHKLLITPSIETQYLPQEIEITINKGRTSTLNIKMQQS